MGDLPHEPIQPYRQPEASDEPRREGDDEMPTLEDALKERAARALDEVLAEKLPQIEEALHAAAVRAIERAMNEVGGTTEATIAGAPAARLTLPPEAPAAPQGRGRPPRPAASPSGPGSAGSPSPPTGRAVVRVPTRRAKQPAAEKASAGRTRGRRSRAQLDETKAKVLEQIKATPGQTSEELVAALAAKRFEATTTSIRLPLRLLAKEGAIHHQGDKRYTRYFPGAGPGAKKKPAKKSRTAKK